MHKEREKTKHIKKSMKAGMVDRTTKNNCLQHSSVCQSHARSDTMTTDEDNMRVEWELKSTGQVYSQHASILLAVSGCTAVVKH